MPKPVRREDSDESSEVLPSSDEGEFDSDEDVLPETADNALHVDHNKPGIFVGDTVKKFLKKHAPEVTAKSTITAAKAKQLVAKQLNRKLTDKEVVVVQESADLEAGKAMNKKAFTAFLESLLARVEVEELFEDHAEDGEISLDAFRDFLHKVQREKEADEDWLHEDGEDWARVVAQAATGKEVDELDLPAFRQYIESPVNSIDDKRVTRDIYQEMDRPLTDYYIASSHNTYLKGDQLKGKAAPEQYSTVLLLGCRCVEVDVWDGKDGQPDVVHGHTLVNRIKFSDVCKAIKKSAFEASPFPVIISLENHASLKQQKEIVKILKKTFGALIPPRFEGEDPLPSPWELRGKILIRGNGTGQVATKDEEEDEDSFAEEEGDSAHEKGARAKADAARKKKLKAEKDKNAKASTKKKEKKPKTIQALADLTHFQKGKGKGIVDLLPWETVSHSEGKVAKLYKTKKKEFIKMNTQNLNRVFPKGTRVDSSNYLPSHGWSVGAQLVALNYQTPALSMFSYLGRFADNGGCGYVLKPGPLLAPGKGKRPQFRPAVELKLTVLSAYRLPFEEGESSVVDPYVVVDIVGAPEDNKSAETGHVPNNGLHPVFSEDHEMSFTVAVPELAVLVMRVLDHDRGTDDLLAWAAFPFAALRNGYRNVPLSDQHYKLLPDASLLVKVELRDAAGKKTAAAARAKKGQPSSDSRARNGARRSSDSRGRRGGVPASDESDGGRRPDSLSSS